MLEKNDITNPLSCVDVVHALYEAVDGGFAAEAIPLFTADAVFDHPAKTFHGTHEIAAFLSAQENDKDHHTLHIVNNTRVKPLASGEHDVCSVVFVHVREGDEDWAVVAIARMRHTVRLEDGEWRIAARVIEALERLADSEPVV